MSVSITVVIPAHNRKSLLPRALDSVLGQTRPADEIILVDDGSTDGTEELQDVYPEVRYLRQANRGVSAARNSGIAAASCDWIAFLDSDDEWLPEKLERQCRVLDVEPTVPLVHSDEIWIRNGIRVNQTNRYAKAGGEIFAHCLPLCAISPSSAIISKALLLELNGFDESLPACEDYDLWLRICARHEVGFVAEPLLKKYAGHEDQLSQKFWGMDRFRVRALDELLASGVLDAAQTELARATLTGKCQVLLQGARKRDNLDLVAQINAIQECHELPVG